jgi:hypothetical protein
MTASGVVSPTRIAFACVSRPAPILAALLTVTLMVRLARAANEFRIARHWSLTLPQGLELAL